MSIGDLSSTGIFGFTVVPVWATAFRHNSTKKVNRKFFFIGGNLSTKIRDGEVRQTVSAKVTQDAVLQIV